jgi:alkylmercury lyase
VVALERTDTALPASTDEIAGALLHGLRGCFRNARMYVAVKRLLANGKPVAPSEIADVLAEPLEDILASLDRTPGIERDPAGAVVGWGLTLKPTPHRFEVEGNELFTWCAFDTLFFPALLGQTVKIHSQCPQSGGGIHLTVRPDGIETVHPEQTVVSIVLPEGAAARSDVRAAFCNQVHYFRDKPAASEWLATHPGGLILPVEEAFEVGRKLSAQVLVEAGEA